MKKEFFEILPDFIKEDYSKLTETSQPISILEHIVYIGKFY
jgi:hypothetical protein